MKRKLLLSLFLLSLSVLIKLTVMADHQDDFSEIKRYEKVSVIEEGKVILSWVNNDKVDKADLYSAISASKKLSVISEDNRLGITFLNDLQGRTIAMIDGVEETILLSYITGEIKKPYNLLEFKLEDNLISKEQFNYIKDTIIKNS